MPQSAIRKLVPYAEEAKARGTKVYHLNIGQPDIDTPVESLAVLHNFNAKQIAYGHSYGNSTYRNRLVDFYNKYGHDLTVDNILVTTGGSEALLMAFMVCFNPGDELILPEPFYTNYHTFALSAGVVIKPIASFIEESFKLPSITEFEKLITPRTKAIFICNPNNPTGYVYTTEELMQLQELVIKHDLFLISDEVYSDFVYDGVEHRSVLSLKEIANRVIVVDSVSKRFSACGIRVGAVITKNKEVFDSIGRVAMSRLCPPMLGQMVAEAALDAPHSYMEEVQKEYKARRDYLITALNQIPGVFAPMPMGAFYGMVRLPIDDSDRFCQWILEEFSHKGATVMMAPATGFYTTPGKGKDEVRMAYVLKIEDIKAAVECLAEALKVYPGRR